MNFPKSNSSTSSIFPIVAALKIKIGIELIHKTTEKGVIYVVLEEYLNVDFSIDRHDDGKTLIAYFEIASRVEEFSV
jgi:hypothetical protein